MSSPKLTEPLRDIPQTITVIPRAVMDEQGATTLRDVLRNVAGITFQAGEGGVPAGDQLSIRGFSARTDMFVDGVRDFGGYSRDSFNMEQVEVAKGPTSTLAGRGSTGGAINQVSKAPGLAPVAEATIGAGNASYQRRTRRSQPAARPTSDSRHCRSASTRCGPTPKCRIVIASSRRAGASRRRSASAAGTRTRATISYFKLEQDNVPEYGLPWVPVNTNPELEAYANNAPPVDQSNFYGLVNRDYEDTDTDLVTADVAHDFGRVTRAKPDAMGPERPRLGHHRAALRLGQHQHGDQSAVAVAGHDRRDPREPDQPHEPRRDWPLGHAIVAGDGVLVGEIGELRAHRPDCAEGRSLQAEPPRPLSGPDCPQRRENQGRGRCRRRRMPSTPIQLARTWS